MSTTHTTELDTADETRDHARDGDSDLVAETAADGLDGATLGIHDMDIREIEQRIHDGTLTDEQRAELDAFGNEAAAQLQPLIDMVVGEVNESFRAMFEQPEFARIWQDLQEVARAAVVAVVHECVAEGARDRVLNGKGDILERLRNVPSVFADNPDACARFREWCETNEHTTEDGKVIYRKLAKCIQASPRIASKYYQHPEEMKALYAKFLFEFVGEQTEYDMMNGWGAYDVDAMEAEKAENIGRIVELLEGMEPHTVSQWCEFIERNPSLFRV